MHFNHSKWFIFNLHILPGTVCMGKLDGVYNLKRTHIYNTYPQKHYEQNSTYSDMM